MPEGLPEWAAGLPEPLHNAPYLKDAKSPEDFVTQISNAASHMGNSVRLPGPDAGEDDIAAARAKIMEKVPGLMPTPNPDDADSVASIMAKLGKPDSADQYLIPEGVEMEPEMLGNLKATAHNLNMTQAQFDAQVSALGAQQLLEQETRSRALETDKATLKELWGHAYAERMGEVGGFLKASKDTPAQFLEAFEGDRMDAATLQFLHRVSQLGGEPGQASTQADGRVAGTPAPAEALERLEEVERRLFSGDGGRPMKETDPTYPGLVAKRMELMKHAYPETSASY